MSEEDPSPTTAAEESAPPAANPTAAMDESSAALKAVAIADSAPVEDAATNGGHAQNGTAAASDNAAAVADAATAPDSAAATGQAAGDAAAEPPAAEESAAAGADTGATARASAGEPAEDPAAATITAADEQPANGAAPQEPAATAPYAFTGMQCVLDKSKAPVRVLSFGRLESSLLAFGADDGTVRVAALSEQKASILHEMREHTKPVTDLDWSLENHQLLTSSEDGSVLLSSNDDDIWSMARRFETSTPARACLFHPVNQNLIIVGTGSGTIEVFNSSTGRAMEECRAMLTSSTPEGVSVAAMDASRDTLFVGDTDGYLHAFSLGLKRGALAPLTLLARIPPAGNRLAQLASLSFTAHAASVKGPALLAAGTDDLVCIYKVVGEKNGKVRLELASKHLMPQSARPIRAAWCPTLPSGEPEYVAMGSEDTAVYVYDVTDAGKAPVPVVRLQGHCSPTVAVAWAFDERRLASSDVDGTVIVWRREHAETHANDAPY